MDRDPDSRWSMDDAAHMLSRLADEHKPEGTLVNTLPNAAPAPVGDVAPEDSRTSAIPSKPRTTTATPPKPRRDAGERPRRRGPVRLVLVALALLLLIGGVAWFVSPLGDGEQANDNAGQASSSSDSTEEEDDGADSTPASSAEEKEEFVRSYFEKAPGGSDEAWAMLGPSLKEQGRESYDGFWGDIESVDVQSVNATENGNTVDVTLVTTAPTGDQHGAQAGGLVSDGDGGYLLDTDTPAE